VTVALKSQERPESNQSERHLLRVLHLVSHFPPDRIGGVGQVVAHVHEGLLDRGHDSHVLTTGTSDEDPRVVRVAKTPGRFPLASALRGRYLRDFDVIHAQHGEAAPLLALSRLSRQRPPVLLTLHVNNRNIAASNRSYDVGGRSASSGLSGVMQRQVLCRAKASMDRAALKLAKRTSFISHSAATDLLGPTAVDATVIYNGLPAPVAAASQPEVERTELLYVGTEGHRKRTGLLPSILAEVRQEHPTARLRIVGFTLKSSRALQDAFAQLDLLDAVIFEGVLPSSEIGRFYRAAGVLVSPSAYEGLPMVILEAQQNALACVATDVGGNSEIIEHGTNGLLTPLDEPLALGAAACRLLSEPDKAARMGQAGQRIVAERFSLDRQLDQYLELYQSMVRTSARPPGGLG